MGATKTSLGISISDGRINLALVRRSSDGIELLKAASGPVPEGAIKNGNVEDAAVLGKAIKELKAKNKIRAKHSVLSLVANPVLMQILDIPKDAMGNVGQFVRNEVKHYATLPIQQIALDFCGLKSSVKSSRRRAIVVATDSQKIADTAKELNKRGLNIDVIEPALLAYIRACYAKKIAKSFDRNLLFVIANEGILTLTLFKNQTLDFLRSKSFEAKEHDAAKFCKWLADEINEVIQFYDLEVGSNDEKWEILCVADIFKEDMNAEVLKRMLDGVDLHVRTLRQAYLDTPVANTKCENKPSAVAIGLAMKLLDIPAGNLDINLLPARISQDKLANKQLLAIANAAAAIFLMMVLGVGYFNLKEKDLAKTIKGESQESLIKDTQALSEEHALLGKTIDDLSARLNYINSVLDASVYLSWGRIFSDLGHATPKNVLIMSLSSSNSDEMSLEGLALSHDAIRSFVTLLNDCENITSASLISTEKIDGTDGLLNYSISCSLVERKG